MGRRLLSVTGALLAALAVGLAIGLGPGAAPAPGSAWSLAPVERPAPPPTGDQSWARSDIDRFILARLEAAGLAPAPEADRATLIRRASYDLTGLPPTLEQVADFLADDAPGAWERLIDRLLASPHYGEKWGRHWLDLVRYAETDGYERDRVKSGAWRYRDWVIEALNADMPYDQFITMQLAGDELPDRGVEQHIATGYMHLGIRDDEPTDPLQAVFDDLDGMLDTTCRVTLAISMGCARCHDHKGDPIPQRDYYRMLSFFEGLKPYKVGGGNGINTDNFVRSLPADLGSDEYERALTQWRRERGAAIQEVQNILGELRERFGDQLVDEAGAGLQRGEALRLGFDEGQPIPGALRGARATPGHAGDALQFERGGRLLIDRPVAESFTISLWFRADRPGAGSPGDLRWFTGSGLVDAEVSGIVDDFGVTLIGDQVAAGVGRPETFVHGPPGAADGAWHHAAFTRDITSGRIALWFDGELVDEAIGGRQPLTTADQVSIGRLLPDFNTFDGAIDEVRFWDRPLADREILDLAIGGGALPDHEQLVEATIGAPEALRLRAAVERIGTLRRPTRQFVRVLSAQELQSPPDSYVRIRGSAQARGEQVRPGFPELLGGGEPQITPPADGETSGRRMALARWITAPDNPRTARVMANRLWQFHMGRGIVGSPNDFGALGEAPTHPELLDWLAAELVEGGWRLKRMHKLIMMSATYRMASVPDARALELDPVNELYSRFHPRRLTAEELRDTLLAINGSLNLEMGGPSVYPPLPEEVLATASRPEEAWGDATAEQAARRSIYIHLKRSLKTPLLESFDMADSDASCPVRFSTTQPTQALTMLNSDFMLQQAELLARRARDESPGDLRHRISRAIELTLARPPSPQEISEGLELIRELEAEEGLSSERAEQMFCLVLLNLNELMFLD